MNFRDDKMVFFSIIDLFVTFWFNDLVVFSVFGNLQLRLIDRISRLAVSCKCDRLRREKVVNRHDSFLRSIGICRVSLEED